jgi:hypothetical protein
MDGCQEANQPGGRQVNTVGPPVALRGVYYRRPASQWRGTLGSSSR